MSPAARALAAQLTPPGRRLSKLEPLAVSALARVIRERETTTRAALAELQAAGRLVVRRDRDADVYSVTPPQAPPELPTAWISP
jgi:hypothetical protein